MLSLLKAFFLMIFLCWCCFEIWYFTFLPNFVTVVTCVWLCQWQEHFHMDFRCTSELWRVKKVVSTLSNCLLCVFSLRVVIQSFSGCLFFSPSHVPLVIFLIVSQSRHSLSSFSQYIFILVPTDVDLALYLCFFCICPIKARLLFKLKFCSPVSAFGSSIHAPYGLLWQWHSYH